MLLLLGLERPCHLVSSGLFTCLWGITPLSLRREILKDYAQVIKGNSSVYNHLFLQNFLLQTTTFLHSIPSLTFILFPDKASDKKLVKTIWSPACLTPKPNSTRSIMSTTAFLGRILYRITFLILPRHQKTTGTHNLGTQREKASGMTAFQLSYTTNTLQVKKPTILH